MAGINFDTANTGYGGNYGGGGYYNGSSILDIAALGLVFGDGFGRRGHYDDKKCGCCSPATCEQVNDVDRDVLKCSFDTTEAVHDEGRRNQKDIWDTDKDVLLGDKCIENKICESTHRLEKQIWDTDKDVIMTACDTNRHIDKVETQIAKESAEIKCLIKQTALEQDNKELTRNNIKMANELSENRIIEKLIAILGKH